MTTSDDFAEMAVEMLADEGVPAVLVRTTAGDYDPETGLTETTTEYTANAMRFEYGQQFIDGETIQRDDFQLYIAPKQTDGTDMPQPIPSDLIQFAGHEYRVIHCKIYNTVGDDMAFIAQCRK